MVLVLDLEVVLADAVAQNADLVLVVEVVVVFSLLLLRILAFENRFETSNSLHFGHNC